jgi:transposase
MKNTTAPEHCTSPVTGRALYLSFELALKKWKLGFITGLADKPRIRNIIPADLGALRREIDLAKRHFKLPDDAPVYSCYEAGREAFSLHRALLQQAINNIIMDSSSIEVPRGKRPVKTDRLDVGKLDRLLFRYHNGEREVCSVVRVPSVEDEDRRQLHREMDTLKAERTALAGRIKSLLVTQGIYWRADIGRLSEKPLDELHTLDGQPLPAELRSRLGREIQRWRAAGDQLRALRRERREVLTRQANEPYVQLVLALMKLRAIGVESAWLLVMELFSWRRFTNRRQVGAMSGMTGVHHGSGDTKHDRGVSRCANYRVRALLVELAWAWLRYQPNSELSVWYRQRFASGSKRLRKIGIVAVARRLTIALWRFLEFGELPAGAELRSEARLRV